MKKKLGNFQLDIEFEIDNKTLSLLGPSGCGKSITLKCIAGIETPDEGQIILNGRTLFDHKRKINLLPQDRKVGLLFQSYALFPNMTLEENILIGVRKNRSNKKSLVKNIINDFSLNGLEDNYPHQLSGGQQQRVAIARMIVNEPEILMFDEPFSALDEHLKWQMERELIDIINKHLGEVLYVSHNKNEVFRISDLIAVINNGKIEDFNTKYDLFNSPKSIYSAILSGYKNISKVQRVHSNKILAIDWNLEFQCNDIKDNISYMAIQEHNLDICDCGLTENTFKLSIDNIVENIYSNTIVLSNIEKSNVPIYMEIPKKDFNLKPKKQIYIRFPKEKIVLF